MSASPESQTENRPENGLETPPESAPENGSTDIATAMDKLGGLGHGFYQPSPKSPAPPATQSQRTVWRDKEDFFRTCIEMGLNADEIKILTGAFHDPEKRIKHNSLVYAYIDGRPELQKLYYAKKTKARRVGDHNKNIILSFMNLFGLAMKYGYEATDVLRDRAPEGEKFRPDLVIRVGGRLFFCEIQLSKIQQTRWREKMRHYLRYYERVKQPFRVLFLVQGGQINTLRAYARDVLKDHPALNLYYFMTLDQFRMTNDVLHEPVWEGARSHAKHSLM